MEGPLRIDARPHEIILFTLLIIARSPSQTVLNYILHSEEKGISRITLNRPDSLNAMNAEMRDELIDAMSRSTSNPEVKVVAIRGAGRAFCAGSDIADLKSGKLGRYASNAILMRSLTKAVEESEKVVVAAINGLALGGGLEFAMCCDLRYAAESAELGLPETNLGIIPGVGGTQRLPRLVGMTKAKELIFLGRRIGAKEAERIGLINRAIPDAEFDAAIDSILKELSERAPVALAAAKYAINKVWQAPALDAGLMYEREASNLCGESQDSTEGLSAFLEKRKPKFKGQ